MRETRGFHSREEWRDGSQGVRCTGARRSSVKVRRETGNCRREEAFSSTKVRRTDRQGGKKEEGDRWRVKAGVRKEVE